MLGGLAFAESLTSVPLWLWISLPVGKILISVLFFLFFVKRIFKQRPRHGIWTLVGKTAHTLAPLHPDGQVRVDGEIWSACSLNDAAIPSNQDVVIRDIRGKVLMVERQNEI